MCVLFFLENNVLAEELSSARTNFRMIGTEAINLDWESNTRGAITLGERRFDDSDVR